MVTDGLVAIWFVPGSALGLILEILGIPVWIQAAMFCIVSIMLLVAFKLYGAKFLYAKSIEPTNTDLLINETGVVVEEISNINATGQVKINGQLWSACLANDEYAPAGCKVKVLSIQGVKLVCKKIKE